MSNMNLILDIMKVIDIEIYRRKRELRRLEEKIGELSLSHRLGSARQIKTCFKEWLKIRAIS